MYQGLEQELHAGGTKSTEPTYIMKVIIHSGVLTICKPHTDDKQTPTDI